MPFIDAYINFERILTLVESRTISQKEYCILKELGQIERNYIQEEFPIDINSNILSRKLLESKINNASYENVSTLGKEIIIANALLPDDRKIADLLNENKFTINDLMSIIRFRSLLKKILANDLAMDQETKEKFTIYKKQVNELIILFKSSFGIDDQTIILNRICEMLVTCPELFETRRNINIKKR